MAGQSAQKARRRQAVADGLGVAFGCYRGGQLDAAEQACHDVLAIDAACFDALHLLALVTFGQGRREEALDRIDQALRVDRRSADALANRASILHRLGRQEEAIISCERALALAPRHVAAMNSRANALQSVGRLEDAIAGYDKVLAHDPRHARALVGRANALHLLGRWEEALAGWDEALAVEPRQALALTCRGEALLRLGRFAEAIECYDQAIAVDPDRDSAWANRGAALESLGRLDEALANHERALALNPRNADVWSNRSNVLALLARADEALESADAALALAPAHVGAWRNRGNALCELGRYVEAGECYARALTLDPADAEAGFNDALRRLLVGDFAVGWEKYELRWKVPRAPANPLAAHAPQWSGREPLAGRTILIYSEQGLGDTFQLLRYVPLVARQAERVLLQVYATIRPLRLSFPDNVTLIDMGDAVPPVDLQCPLLSLPRAFATDLASIPPSNYLAAPPARVAAWAERLPHGRRRVGLTWAGNPGHRNDRKRSIPLQRLAPLIALPDPTFISLQRDLRPGDDAFLHAHPAVVPLGEALTDFAETAAIISQLDLVICVDSAVAHLAGAMGARTWIMLPFRPDWRWLVGRDDSPWYPSARLFRQPSPGDWDSVIARIAQGIRDELSV